MVGGVGGETDEAGLLAVQAQPELAGGEGIGGKRDDLALVHGGGRGQHGNGRRGEGVEAELEALVAAARIGQGQHLGLVAAQAHRRGFLDDAPVGFVGRVHRFGQPQAGPTLGCGQGHGLARQAAYELDGESGRPAAGHADIAGADGIQGGQGSLDIGGECCVRKGLARGIQGIRRGPLATVLLEAIEALPGQGAGAHGKQEAGVDRLAALGGLAGTAGHAWAGQVHGFHRHRQIGGLAHQGEGAGEAAETGNAQGQIPRQGQSALAVETGTQGAGGRHPIHAADGARAFDETALRPVGGNVQGAGAILDCGCGAAGGKGHSHAGGGDVPAAAAVDRLVQNHAEAAGEAGLAQGQGGAEGQIEPGGGLAEDHRRTAVQGQGQVARGPVDEGCGGVPQGAAVRAQGPIDAEPGGGDLGDFVAGHGGAAIGGLPREPAPGRGSAGRAAFRGQHHRQAGVGEGRIGAGADGNRGSKTGAAEDQFIHDDSAAVGQGDGATLAGLDEHLTIYGQHAGNVRMDLAPQACFAGEQAHAVPAGAGGDGGVHGGAHLVDGDLQIGGREGHGGNASEAGIAFRLDGVVDAGGVLPEQYRTATTRQAGAGAADAETGADAFQADDNVVYRNAGHHALAGDDGEGAGEGADTDDGDGAAGNIDRLHRLVVGKREGHAVGAALGDCLAHRHAQMIDGHGGRGGEASGAAETGEGRRTGGLEGVAALPQGIRAQEQAQGGIAHRELAAGGAELAGNAGGADEYLGTISAVLAHHGHAAGEGTEAFHRQGGGAREGKLAIAAKARRGVAGQGEPGHAAHIELARQGTAAAAIRIHPQATGSAGEAHEGGASSQKELGIADLDAPAGSIQGQLQGA